MMKKPRFKDDDIRDVILAIIVLIILDGCATLAVGPPAPHTLVSSSDAWRW